MKAGARPGCAAVAWVLLQPAVTLAALLAIGWMDPAWLDRRAFWRAERLPADVVLLSDAASREAAHRDLPVPAAAEPARIKAVEDDAGSAMVDPAQAARVATRDGAALELPAGALAGRAAVTVAPVSYLPQEMAGPVTGPAVTVRVAGEEEVRLARTGVLQLPFRRELFAEGAPVIGEFGREGWTVLPSRVDAVRGTVSADVTGGSVFAVLNPSMPVPVSGALVGGTALAAAGYVLSSADRERLWQRVYTGGGCSGVRETTNFLLHWCAQGPQAAEAGLPAAVAEHLERAYAGLSSVGMKPDVPVLRKYPVFLGQTPSYGDTATGGPVFLHARLREMAAADNLPPDDVLRAVAAHELVHLGQGRFFSTLGQGRFGWWLEMSAAYLADLYWDREGRPVDLGPARDLRAGAGRLPTHPMDRAEAPELQGYASFLRWLDTQKPGAGLTLTQAVNSRGEATLPVLDAVARESLGQGLAALFTRYAQAFYHDDLWTGQLAPRLHRGGGLEAALAHTAPDNARAFAGLVVPHGDAAVTTPYAASTSAPLRHLSAAAFSMSAGGLSRRGRLVVRLVRMADASAPLEAWVGVGRLQAPGRANTGFRRVWDLTTVVDGVGAGGVDHVTVVVVNPSLQADTGAVSAERWLLLPPEAVRYEQRTPGGWTVTWTPVALQQHPEAFRGYTVYRRRPTAPDTAWAAVRADVSGTSWTDRPHEGGDWVYTVRAVDVLGNESDPAPVAGADPVAGAWTGRVRLLEGDGAWEPLVAAVLRAGDPEAAAVARQARRLGWIGVPVRVRVERREGRHVAIVERIGWATVQGRELALDLVGPRTLAPAEWAGPGPRPLFRLTRTGEIRADEVALPGPATLAWSLHRTND